MKEESEIYHSNYNEVFSCILSDTLFCPLHRSNVRIISNSYRVIEIRNNFVSLQSAINDALFCEENRSVYCNLCKPDVLHISKLSISDLPDSFIFHVQVYDDNKRYDYINLISNISNARYLLKSFACYVNDNHYVSYIQNSNNSWSLFDDTKNVEHIMNAESNFIGQALVFFYELESKMNLNLKLNDQCINESFVDKVELQNETMWLL